MFSKPVLLGLAKAFIVAFVGAFLPLVSGILAAPNLDVARALLVSAIVGALGVAVRATIGLILKDEHPVPDSGVEL